LIRARLLAAEGLFDLIEPEDLNGQLLMQKVLGALKPIEVRSTQLDLEGLPRIRERLRLMLEEAEA
jgi:predicted glycosyltransferase